MFTSCWTWEWTFTGCTIGWADWVTTWCLKLEGKVATWIVLCWFKTLGCNNAQVVGMDDFGTICGRLIGGDLKSNQPNWIKSTKGWSNPTILAKDQ